MVQKEHHGFLKQGPSVKLTRINPWHNRKTQTVKDKLLKGQYEKNPKFMKNTQPKGYHSIKIVKFTFRSPTRSHREKFPQVSGMGRRERNSLETCQSTLLFTRPVLRETS